MGQLIVTPITTWTDEVYQRAPGATAGGVEQAMWAALREFCKQSGAWVVELWDKDTANGNVPKPFNLGDTTSFYDFQALLETARAGAGGSYTGGNPGTAFAQYQLLEDYWPWDILYIHRCSYFNEYTWNANAELQTHNATRFIYPTQTPFNRRHRSVSTTGWPNTFKTFNERPGVIQLQSNMTQGMAEGAGLVPWVSLGFPVGYIADSIPVVFERLWYEHILDGTLSKLLSQQDKSYTNPVLAQYHGARFRNGIAEARDVARRQLSNSESEWHYPAWA